MQLIKAHWIEVVLYGGFLLSVATKNKTMWMSLLVVIVLRLLRADALLRLFSAKGINWGILILTIGFLSPIATGKYTLEQLRAVFTTPEGMIAIVCGILIALLGAKGIVIGQTDILTTVGVIVGTFLGVAFFRGSPMGPLVGSGIAFVAIRCYHWMLGLFAR